GVADEESQPPAGSHQASGDGQNEVEAFHSSHGDDVGASSPEVLCARVEYIDICQCKGSADFAQEGRLFLVRFDERDMKFGYPDLNGQAWKASTRADVDEGVVGPSG